MIKVEFVDDGFIVHGSFDMGAVGVYEDDKIEIPYSLDEIYDEVRDSGDVYKELKTALSDVEKDGNAYAEILTDFYNNLEKKVIFKHSKIEGEFLCNMFFDMEICGKEFWENEETLNEGFEDKEFSEEEVYGSVSDEFNSLYEDEDNENKTETLRKLYPMFNIDALIEGIETECLTLDMSTVSYQCSDGWGALLLCAAYDELDEDFNGTDWHNF